jgi:hypothetical protein
MPALVSACRIHGPEMYICPSCLQCVDCCNYDGCGMPAGTRTERQYPGHTARLQAFVAWINSEWLAVDVGEEVCRWIIRMADDFPECLMTGEPFEDTWLRWRLVYLDWLRDGFIVH